MNFLCLGEPADERTDLEKERGDATIFGRPSDGFIDFTHRQS